MPFLIRAGQPRLHYELDDYTGLLDHPGVESAHDVQIVQPAMTATTLLHFIAAHDGIACRE